MTVEGAVWLGCGPVETWLSIQAGPDVNQSATVLKGWARVADAIFNSMGFPPRVRVGSLDFRTQHELSRTRFAS
jgi:hypothetical protein